MAIGYEKGRNLMRHLDWKMLVTAQGEEIQKISLYHPSRPNTYNMRNDSGVKLMKECRVIQPKDPNTTILCYDWDGSNEENI